MHNWASKLIICYFNMGFNIVLKIYKVLIKKNTSSQRILKVPAVARELVHAIIQQRDAILFQELVEHPQHPQDLTNVFDFGIGQYLRADAHCAPTKVAARA